MARVLYGVLFLVLMSQLACSAPQPTMTATATPVFTAAPDSIVTPGPTNRSAMTPGATPARPPAPTATAMPPTPTATAVPATARMTAKPPETPHSSPNSPDGDREALATLYKSARGPEWRNNANWLSGEPLGEWYGVTSDGDGRVTHLSPNPPKGCSRAGRTGDERREEGAVRH